MLFRSLLVKRRIEAAILLDLILSVLFVLACTVLSVKNVVEQIICHKVTFKVNFFSGPGDAVMTYCYVDFLYCTVTESLLNFL